MGTEVSCGVTGATPETVRAFYGLDDPEAPEGRCETCGEPLDKCCGRGAAQLPGM